MVSNQTVLQIIKKSFQDVHFDMKKLLHHGIPQQSYTNVYGSVHVCHLSSSSMDDIQRGHFHPWNCHSSDFSHILQSFEAILAKIDDLCEQNVTDDNSIHG